MKNLIRSWVSTLFGLVLLGFATYDIFKIVEEAKEFDWMFTSGLVVVGLILLMTSDKWVVTLLNKVFNKTVK